MASFEDLKEMIGSRATKKLAGNTYARLEDGGETVVVKYHQTDIGRVTADTVTLDSGGWRTYTTKERINSYVLPYGYGLSQTKGVWWLYRYSPAREDGLQSPRVRFEDGMTINTVSGEISGVPTADELAETDSANSEIKKRISHYVKLYTDERLRELLEDLKSGKSRGDCFACQFKMTGEDHFLSHLEEEYTMGSLAWNAIEERGYGFPDVIMAYSTDSARRSIKRYLERRLLIGVAV
jgi:hypothetical protein